MPLQTVIFDMDGVIINSEPIYFAVESAFFHHLGIAVTTDELYSFVGIPDQDMWRHLKALHGLPQQIDELVFEGRRRYREHLEQHGEHSLVPGALECAGRLRAHGLRLAIASSSARDVIDRVCELCGLHRFFGVTVSGDEVPHGKPAPDIFLHTGRLTKTNPADCLVIEDSRNGVFAAKAAGMKCLGFRNPDSGEQDLSAADGIIDAFETLTTDKVEALFQ